MHRAMSDLAIVVLGTLEDEATAIKVVQAGAQDYLVKSRADGEMLARSLRYDVERRRLSMDIHDGPLQSLGVFLMAIDRAQRRQQREGEVLSSYGLAFALSSHIERFSSVTGIDVRLNDDVDRRLTADIELLMYRLAQESLANIRKHSQAFASIRKRRKLLSLWK